MTNYQQYSDLEHYIFNDVNQHFHQQGFLNAIDFFCIVIWKANRAKSKVAKKLVEGGKSLEGQVKLLTQDINAAPTSEEKLKVMLSAPWKFRLPMATAILTVLYPEEFTIYDVRVCEALGNQSDLGYKLNFNSVWSGYLNYKRHVETEVPTHLSLLDKDKYLWGKSFHNQLEKDILEGFNKAAI